MAYETAAPTPGSPPALAPLPIRALLPWAALFGLLMLMLVFFVSAAQGPDGYAHEWVHDGRHLLGFPCH